MNAQKAADVVSLLTTAVEPGAIGPTLAAALGSTWGADAAIVWLPSGDEDIVRLEELSVSGELTRLFPLADLLAPLRERRMKPWLASHGVTVCYVMDLLPVRRGQIVVGWCEGGSAPPQIDAVLELIAMQVSLLFDRQQLEERLAAADALRIETEDHLVRTRRVWALGEMASVVVHDFNNYLTSILGFTELALGPLEEHDTFYADLNSIRTAALDAASLVRRLQSFGRKGREHDEREIVDVRDIVRVMPTLARPRWTRLSQCHGLSFEVVVDAQTAPRVQVVVAEIRDLLLNLLFNAVDAMPLGGRITIGTREIDGWAEISVTDEGVGMSDDVKERVFQPFFSTKGDQGSGLGLSACRTIADRHGAQLDVTSKVGQGTTLRLRLPPAVEELVAASVPRPAEVVSAPAIVQHVMLVDDQEEIRASVGDMLRALGHSVTVADSGEAALALARHVPIDVVMTDLGMPGMNGTELARRLRVLYPRLPVVLLTGWGLAEDAASPANIASVLAKPVTMKSLAASVAACVTDGCADRRSVKCS
jgi:signal transduction histidine kinase/CheY-like chemotaxis protein